ncbi:transcription termination factor MTERF8, chloroplastic-like [Henckelia pumila]|uniref:transcription termination factor MTERF8, chloroplastic-like n=1 Tax=Henckelia pumila TaxID=405737 RepID=UPI003C6DEFC0
MSTMRSRSLLCFRFCNFHLNPSDLYSPCITFSSPSSLSCTYTSTPHSDLESHVMFKFLIDSLKCRKQKALTSTNHLTHVKSTKKPQAAVHFLRSHGFSDTQIRSLLYIHPKLLLFDVERILKPKLVYFQELGVPSPHLAKFISRNPLLLASSLDKKLKPGIELIKKILELNRPDNSKCNINDELFHILSRYSFAIWDKSTLLSNIKYLESCGIVGSQLISLLKNDPRLFSVSETKLKALISRVTELGFAMGSRMLVYGVLACYGNTTETLNKKYNLFQSFGFTECECKEMLVKSPILFKSSEARLRRGMEFFLNTLKLDKSVIFGSPYFLMCSMEKRILPRYRVVQVAKSKRLVERLPSITSILRWTDKKFMEKFVLRFEDDAKELMLAFEGHLSET